MRAKIDLAVFFVLRRNALKNINNLDRFRHIKDMNGN